MRVGVRLEMVGAGKEVGVEWGGGELMSAQVPVQMGEGE